MKPTLIFSRDRLTLLIRQGNRPPRRFVACPTRSMPRCSSCPLDFVHGHGMTCTCPCSIWGRAGRFLSWKEIMP